MEWHSGVSEGTTAQSGRERLSDRKMEAANVKGVCFNIVKRALRTPTKRESDVLKIDFKLNDVILKGENSVYSRQYQ